MPIPHLLNNADISKVSDGLKDAKQNNFPNKTLLSSSNPFLLSNNPGKTIKDRLTNSLSLSDLKEYIAVSTFVHCVDGWSYLSHAIHALLEGEPSISTHLAYYSELRGAISFLCSEGILIANSEQACIDNNNTMYVPSDLKSTKINGGTHTVTWEIISEWINNTSRNNNALEYFKYSNKTFKELIQFIPFAGVSSSSQLIIVKDWLKTWCFDITRFKSDREERNNSSYNAVINRNTNPSKLIDRLRCLNDFWYSLEPSIGSFSNLDRHLFALYLKQIYDTAANSGRVISKNDFINTFFDSSGITKDSLLIDIFTNNKCNQLIRHASDIIIDPITKEAKPLTIIARAILLLRYSTGACNFLFTSNNITRSDLNFYINKTGEDFCLWNTSAPEDLNDLWTDINDLLTEFEKYLATSNPNNMFAVREAFKDYSPIYTQFSRAGLWGLNLK